VVAYRVVTSTVKNASSLWSTLIDPAALEVPFEDELCHVDKDGAAQLLDGALRRLGAARGAVERQVGRRLVALKRGDGFKKLGCSSQSDYIIERTEMGVRSAQEMMRVAAKLETLPLLRRALDKGTLTTSQVRVLVRIAKAENEATWMEWARETSVRTLVLEVRRALEEAHKAGDAAPTPHSAGDTTEDQEEAAELTSFVSPEWFKVKWAAAVELFRKLEGHDGLGDGAAAEAFVAEWQAGIGPVPETVGAAVMAEERKGSGRPAPSPAGSSAENQTLRAYLEQETERWSFLPAEPPAIELPAGLAASDGELSDDPRVLDEELREAKLRGVDALSGRILLTMSRVGLFQAMRFVDVGHYAVERLGLSPRKARELKRIERLLFDLPLLQQAYFAGELGDAKIRLLVRVATERTEALWLERARCVTVRRLDDEVRWAEARGALREAGLIEPTPRERELGIGQLEPPPEGFDVRREGEALAELGRTGDERHTSAPSATVRFTAELEVAQLWRETVALCRSLHGRRLAEWHCADRFVDAFFAEWERKDPYGAVLAHKVMARDGYRCTVPGCRSRRGLHAHHISWRSRGGNDEMSNLTTVCSTHHLHGLHEAWVEVTGEAPHNLTWRLGVVANDALWTVGPGEVIARG